MLPAPTSRCSSACCAFRSPGTPSRGASGAPRGRAEPVKCMVLDHLPPGSTRNRTPEPGPFTKSTARRTHGERAAPVLPQKGGSRRRASQRTGEWAAAAHSPIRRPKGPWRRGHDTRMRPAQTGRAGWAGGNFFHPAAKPIVHSTSCVPVHTGDPSTDSLFGRSI
eukprot:gene11211-biopygen1821